MDGSTERAGTDVDGLVVDEAPVQPVRTATPSAEDQARARRIYRRCMCLVAVGPACRARQDVPP